MDIPSTSYSLLAAFNGAGDSEITWNAFHARYRDVILNWCRRRGLDADAEDMTQEILLKLIRVLPRHVHNPALGPFRGWLKTVVENALRDFWRQRERRSEPLVVGGSTFLHNMGNLADLDAGIDELSTALEQRAQSDAVEIVNRARSRVNDKTWQAFVQTSFEKRPAAEVAQELGLTTATVFKHAYRVKQILLEEMRRDSSEGGEAEEVSCAGSQKMCPSQTY